jgi:hypothetical protein
MFDTPVFQIEESQVEDFLEFHQCPPLTPFERGNLRAAFSVGLEDIADDLIAAAMCRLREGNCKVTPQGPTQFLQDCRKPGIIWRPSANQ